MKVSHKHRFVFLANPKTGSATVHKVLQQYADIDSLHISEIDDDFPFYHHMPARQLKPIFEQRGWDWSSYRVFCIVRNPFDRIVSLYHFEQRRTSRPAPGRSWLYNLARRVKYTLDPVDNFRDFVFAIEPTDIPASSLDNFACDKDGTLLVDDVLRFENLMDDLPAILADVGINLSSDDIPHLNASPGRGAYRDYYDEDTRAKVARDYAYDIEHFGYTF